MAKFTQMSSNYDNWEPVLSRLGNNWFITLITEQAQPSKENLKMQMQKSPEKLIGEPFVKLLFSKSEIKHLD